MNRFTLAHLIRNAHPTAGLFALLLSASATSAGNPDRNVTADSFDAQVIDTSKQVPIIVEFYADWCGYCRKLRPVLESLAQEYHGRALFVRVDIEAEPELAERFGVDGIPVVYVFETGLPLSRMAGAVSRNELKEMVDGFTVDP